MPEAWVLVEVEDGMVTQVSTSGPIVRIAVLDHDSGQVDDWTDSAESLFAAPGAGGGTWDEMMAELAAGLV